MASKVDVRLTKREQVIFDLLKRDRVATLERIHQTIATIEPEEIRRGSVNSTVKNLMTKVPHMGYLIQRTTPLGRGNKATYRMSQVKFL